MAILEGLVGLALFILPAVTVSNLLNTPLDTPGGLVGTRLAGAAIIGLAIACWQSRNLEKSAAKAIVSAMFFYNIAAALVLAYSGIRLGLQSVFIWPIMVVHGALAIGCGVSIWLAMRKPEISTDP